MPIGDIDLATVVSDKVVKAPRDLCARPNTILLESSSDDLIIAGLVRQVCKQDATLLGSLMPSAEWITDQLTNLTLATSQYTYKL
ncbi:hypothetical protein MSG28_013869 [Choristoneura fumiferana]|uniref:Uncharacterized protein n=1 Tax=Choristoneura fumiferana TaxID=7141 RepID=A0ACC0K985_CHOFU|nr:hypothetical protein MSG28_013869 [Choristoneura fumiferana]